MKNPFPVAARKGSKYSGLQALIKAILMVVYRKNIANLYTQYISDIEDSYKNDIKFISENTPESGVPLGNTAKSSSPPENAASQGRLTRYQALSSAREILVKDSKKLNPNKYPGDVYRTADCRYVMRSSVVKIHHSEQYRSAFYSGLATCGSVWACPVCTSKIQERRRHEIDIAINWAKMNGYEVMMVTFTFPHHSWHSLSELLARQKDAFRRLRSGKVWQEMKKSVGFLGLIRSLEVVYGQNGWHPHTHELWFVKKFVGDYWIMKRWENACIKSGLLNANDEQKVSAFREHSVDVKRDVDQGDYLAKQDDSRKWGLADEVAKATSKKGRSKGVHPHHFLIRKSEGDEDRYLEYVSAMKGQRQLFWSKGLKKMMGVLDISDEELVEDQRETADILACLDKEQWSYIRGNDARAQLLDAAENGGKSAVNDFLVALGAQPITLGLHS